MAKQTAITHRQRSALRAQHKLKPYLTGIQLQKWFEEEYNQNITPSTISRTLSTNYNWLDTAKDYQLDAKKHRAESWPELEQALYEWIQRAETQISVSQELVREKARQFWPSLYPEKKMPQFSNGWLQRFQNRRNIRSNTRHGEAGSLSTDADEEMIRIRQVINKYSAKDIFNCDETGLYWRMIPDRSLTTCSIPGKRKDKARITLHFCTNSDASERLPIWIIGTAKKPRVFQAAGINIENLGCYWRYNKKAWMTGKIFEEWLCWFDTKMTGRNVLLLMDNFSAHESAVKNVSIQLQNTLVVWLPANSTTKYQPLDQGIIRTWKAYWKRQWLLYMMTEFDRGYDPMATMTILNAVRWAIQAWEVDLSPEAIQNCFTKALAARDDAEMVSNQLLQELQAGLDQLAISNIKEIMKIDQFLNPAEEEVTDNLEDLDSLIISQFSAEGAESDDNDEVYEVLPKISANEALEALYKLRLFEEQQADGNRHLLKELLHHERALVEKKMRNQYQTDIRTFFS